MTNNRTSIFFVGAFIIAGTLGSQDNRSKEFMSGVYGSTSTLHVKQNAKVNPSNTHDGPKTSNHAAVLLQPTDDQNQPIVYHQPSNQQAILISDQQNQNQQTLFLSNLPQQVFVPSNQQPITNQQSIPHSSNLLYIQKPAEQQTIWLTSQPNNQPNQIFVNQPSNVQPNQQVIMLQQRPDNSQVVVNQPSNMPAIVQEANQQGYLYISSQPNQQHGQQGTIQVVNKPMTEQPNQQQIWIASQPNQPAVLVNQQANQPTSGPTDLPTMVNIGQPALKPNHGNVFIVPINENASPNAQQGNTYYIPIQQGMSNPVYTLSGRK